MPTITLDNLPLPVPDGITVLAAARLAGITIPALCNRPDAPDAACNPLTSCMVCVVRINNSPKLSPACATVVRDGMTIESETPAIHAARRTALELILSDHAGECLAPCQLTCPAHMNIPLMLHHIAAGRHRDALITVKRRIPLPATLGRICPELCETPCRRADMDDAVSICRLKRFVADTDLASDHPYLPPKAPPTGKRIAIVGAGPAGLSAAYYLLTHGHHVTLYDRNPLPGGSLRKVPHDQLPPAVLDAEIALIETLGARFVQGAQLAPTGPLTLATLRDTYHAVLLATGTLPARFAAALGLATTPTTAKIDRPTMTTSLPGVFVAGNAYAPGKHAIKALADGTEVADLITAFLANSPLAPRHNPFSTRLGKLSDAELPTYLQNATPTPRTPASAQHPHIGIAAEDAPSEAARCLECSCAKADDCRLRTASISCHADPTKFRGERRPFARTTTHPDIIFEPGKCIACGLCVQIASELAEPFGLTHIGRGFQIQIAPALNTPLTTALQKAALQAAQSCPTAALTLKPPA